MINPAELTILKDALDTLANGFSELPDFEADIDTDAIDAVLQEVAVRMQDNYPYHHPRYAGQMLKPPHAVARIAYMLALWTNPNNHALDGGRASSALEKECVQAIGTMFGLDDPLGHLCGGGTMANLEALWVAGRLHPGKKIIASAQAHYTHARISEVLALEFAAVSVTDAGTMDLEALESVLAAGDVGTVVATLGTTGIGAVDPLPDILKLARKYEVRVHVDTAYGGYFTLSSELASAARDAFDVIAQADSVVIDPHKHGLQPYGCGCILFRDSSVGALYKHDSPYTYFSSAELHLGEISLECSRPGAAAVALWATQQLFPMDVGGEFAQDLDRSLLAARALWNRVEQSNLFKALMPPELDIVVYAVNGADAASISEHASEVFHRAASKDLHLALIELPVDMVRHYWPDLIANRDTVRVLRSCLMKPEHLDWLDDMWPLLEAAVKPSDDD
ncbi:MAG: aspartate aminotransferase family protein [Gammaproteobacteria bacterium]|nr:aspartate aminotransferase family protein [Gammaproteobacteria bacterium]